MDALVLLKPYVSYVQLKLTIQKALHLEVKHVHLTVTRC
jgi:hypothetical protein